MLFERICNNMYLFIHVIARVTPAEKSAPSGSPRAGQTSISELSGLTGTREATAWALQAAGRWWWCWWIGDCGPSIQITVVLLYMLVCRCRTHRSGGWVGGGRVHRPSSSMSALSSSRAPSHDLGSPLPFGHITQLAPLAKPRTLLGGDTHLLDTPRPSEQTLKRL